MQRLLSLLLAAVFSMSCEAPASSDMAPKPKGLVDLPSQQLVKGGRYRVISVVDGDTVTLSTGQDVRIVGTQAPKLPLGRPGFKPWPLGDAAKDHLSDLVAGREVTLHFGGLEEDRHGRLLAHLERDDGLWLQGAMLEAGYARVYTFPDNRSAVAQMLAAESAARAAKRGIWSHPYYAVRTPKALERDIGTYEDTYQIVRGRVLGTGDAGGRIFINFGGDWDTDFTAVIQRSAVRKFKAAPQFDPERLEGALVEIRGWIEENRGPSIDVTHPEQIVYVSGK